MHKGINTTADEGQTPIVVHGTQDPDLLKDTAHTLGVNGGQENALAFDTTQITHPENRSNPQPGDPCHPLAADAHPPAIAGTAVRRLTPLECERLQGFPDNYTNIPGASDSARYKALGNSMAVPVMRWIGERLQRGDQHEMHNL